MKTRCRFVFSLAIVLPLLVSTTTDFAAAHVLRQDSGISAELHIPPADKPRAGEPTKLELSFGDDKDAFRLQDCNCQLEVVRGNQPTQAMSLKPAAGASSLSSTPEVEFPSAGSYSVVVQGSAKDGAFNTFRLEYPVQVSAAVSPQATKATQDRGHVWVIAIILGAAVLLIVRSLLGLGWTIKGDN